MSYTVDGHATPAQTPSAGRPSPTSLDDVLDDADYNGDAAATSGTVTSTSNTVRWTGDLAVGATATITYSVTVQAADLGDDLLTNRSRRRRRGKQLRRRQHRPALHHHRCRWPDSR